MSNCPAPISCVPVAVQSACGLSLRFYRQIVQYRTIYLQRLLDRTNKLAQTNKLGHTNELAQTNKLGHTNELG